LQSAVGLDGQVILRNGSTTTSLDAATGQTRWTWQGARTFASIGGGQRVLLLSADRLILLDDQGRQLRDWPVSLGELELYPSFLSAADGRVLAVGPTALSLGVAK
jgi:outer membrane protein assembly factor BamB